MNGYYRLLVAFVLCTLLIAGWPAQVRAGQQASLSMEVRSGYDGSGQYRSGHWFPVSIIVSNDGNDLSGAEIEWSFPGSNAPSFRYTIDLPSGARKQVNFAVVNNDNARLANLRLSSNGGRLAEQVVRLQPITSDQLAIGVLSNDQGLLSSLTNVEFVQNYTTVLTRIDPGMLPTDATVLSGLDALFINDIPTDALSPAQIEALKLWLRLGGILVIGGGPNASQTAAAFSDILPVEIGGLSTDVPVGSVEILAGQPGLQDLLPEFTSNTVQLREGAEDLDGAQLLTSTNVGVGSVIFAAFDLSLLRAWIGEPELWSELIDLNDRMLFGYSFRWSSDNLTRDTLQLAALQVPSPSLLFCLILGYILIIGPINFLLLRRFKRVEWAWITTPVLVMIFLFTAYGASFMLRGFDAKLSQLAIVQGFEAEETGQATAFINIFSPQRRSYDISLDPATLISPGTFQDFQFNNIPVHQSDTAAQVDDLLVDVSSIRTIMTEQMVSNVPSVASQLEIRQNQVIGEVSNTSGITLQDAKIVVGNSSIELGDLAAGATVPVDLTMQQMNFPGFDSTADGDLFQRSQVLYNIFNYDRFALGGMNFTSGQGIPRGLDVYLVAWSSEPTFAATINGDSAGQQGETLYLIRLDV